MSTCWRSGSGARAIAGGHDNVVVVKIGTGIGAGIISDGQLHRGAQGSAGDVGHIQVIDDPTVVCRCGNVGCLEALAGGRRSAGPARPRREDGRSPRLRTALEQRGTVTAEDVARAASFGDPVAVALLGAAGRRVGSMLASVVNFFNPSLIVIGGGVANSPDQLLAAIRETIYGRSLPLATRDLLIQRSSLGDLAGVIGASAMVVDQLFARESIGRWIEAGEPVGRADGRRRSGSSTASPIRRCRRSVPATTRSLKSPEAGSLRISLCRPSGRISRLMTTWPSYISGVEAIRGVEPPRHSRSTAPRHAPSPTDRRRP